VNQHATRCSMARTKASRMQKKVVHKSVCYLDCASAKPIIPRAATAQPFTDTTKHRRRACGCTLRRRRERTPSAADSNDVPLSFQAAMAQQDRLRRRSALGRLAVGLDRVLARRRRVRGSRRGRARARAAGRVLAGRRRTRTGATRRARAARGARTGAALAAGGTFGRDTHKAAAEVRVVELLNGVLHFLAGRELSNTGYRYNVHV
jgi:hypothetical protein